MTPPANDLSTSPLKRTIRSGGLTFQITYSPSTPIEQWTPSGPKSIRVSVTARNDGVGGQKLYLTRATVRFSVSDGSALAGPDPIVDSANISPGYFITSPYSYEQSFAIPPIDDGAQSAQLDFKYEVVSLVDSKLKDYTKQTAADSVRIALNF